MGRLTVDERRRVFVAQEQGRQKAFTALPAPSVVSGPRGRARGLQDVVTIAVIVVGLAVGSVAWRVVEFHRPLSLLEAVLPRA